MEWFLRIDVCLNIDIEGILTKGISPPHSGFLGFL